MIRFIDNNALQEELIKLEQILSVSLPALETLSQSNLDTLTASSNISRVIADWDMLAQMEALNAFLAESFAVQQELSQAVMDWDMLAQMEGLNALPAYLCGHGEP